jgi:ProP effector
MPDRARKTLHLPAKLAAKVAAKVAPAKPRVSPEEQRAREAADQEAKRIRLAALSKDAEVLKISLIDRYPHLFAVNPPRPLASGIHRVLAEQTGAPKPVLKLALTKLTRRKAYLAALSAGGPRYDIDGRPSGMISPDDQQAAAAALQRRLVRSPQAMARRKERQTAAAAGPDTGSGHGAPGEAGAIQRVHVPSG